jgi:hypothetical protein
VADLAPSPDIKVNQPVPSVKSMERQNQTTVPVIQTDSRPNMSITINDSMNKDVQSPLLPSGGEDLMMISKLDVDKCHSLGVQLANTLRERLESAQSSRQTDKVGDGTQDEWLFEDMYSSSLREYVHTMVSNISEIIRGFIQKASTLVDSESLKISAAIQNLRNDLPEDEQHQVHWPNQIDLTQTETGHNEQPQIILNPLTKPSEDIDESVCSLVNGSVGVEWWRNVPFSDALSAIGSHCIDALLLANKLLENNRSKQKAEMKSLVRATVKQQQEQPTTEVPLWCICTICVYYQWCPSVSLSSCLLCAGIGSGLPLPVVCIVAVSG